MVWLQDGQQRAQRWHEPLLSYPYLSLLAPLALHLFSYELECI